MPLLERNSLGHFCLCALVSETLTSKSVNSIFWSPKGNFLVMAGFGHTFNGTLEFWNANDLEMMAAGEHFLATQVLSCRVLCTSVVMSYVVGGLGSHWSLRGNCCQLLALAA